MILRTILRLLLLFSSAFHTVHNASFIRIDTGSFENICALRFLEVERPSSMADLLQNVTHLQKDAAFFRILSRCVIALCAILCDERRKYTFTHGDRIFFFSFFLYYRYKNLLLNTRVNRVDRRM